MAAYHPDLEVLVWDPSFVGGYAAVLRMRSEEGLILAIPHDAIYPEQPAQEMLTLDTGDPIDRAPTGSVQVRVFGAAPQDFGRLVASADVDPNAV